ncbi:MAG TPA: hypothetical protein VI455_19435 [Terriglobia bacterium]
MDAKRLCGFGVILKHDLLESEISLLADHLLLAKGTGEREFRDSGKARRPPDEWRQQWFDGVKKIAAAHQLDYDVVWEVARNVEARLKRELPFQVA